MKHKHRNKKVVVKLVLAGTAFLALAAVCVYTVFIRPNLTAETVIYMESQVQSGSLVQGIIESGSITLQESYIRYDLDINYSEDEEEDDEEEEASRYLQIEEVYAVQGQRMQEGDPLFKLSQDSIAAVRRKLQKAKSYAGCGIGGEGFSTVPGKKGAFPGGGQQLCGNRADPSERH